MFFEMKIPDMFFLSIFRYVFLLMSFYHTDMIHLPLQIAFVKMMWKNEFWQATRRTKKNAIGFKLEVFQFLGPELSVHSTKIQGGRDFLLCLVLFWPIAMSWYAYKLF